MDALSIVVTGPESSGKSELCRDLAAHFQCSWVPEYAREYLETNGPVYGFKDLEKMMAGQLQLIEAQKNEALKIIDTDLVNYAVWSTRVFGFLPEKLEERLMEMRPTVYLLCFPDLRWEPDPLRENPHDRLAIFKEHQQWIEKTGVPYRIIKGQKKERLKNTLDALEEFLQT